MRKNNFGQTICGSMTDSGILLHCSRKPLGGFSKHMLRFRSIPLAIPTLLVLSQGLSIGGTLTFAYTISGPPNLATNGPPGLVRVGTYTVDQAALTSLLNGSSTSVPMLTLSMTTYYVGSGSINFS